MSNSGGAFCRQNVKDNSPLSVFCVKCIKRALWCIFHITKHMGIDHRRPYVAVTEKHLDGTDIIIRLQKVRGETVAEGVIERISIFCYSAVTS